MNLFAAKLSRWYGISQKLILWAIPSGHGEHAVNMWRIVLRSNSWQKEPRSSAPNRCRHRRKRLENLLVSTDPPYYDNIGYAGLSDFFYIWLGRPLVAAYPDLFSTVLVPKMPELTASPDCSEGQGESQRAFRIRFSKRVKSSPQQNGPSFSAYGLLCLQEHDEEDSVVEDPENYRR